MAEFLEYPEKIPVLATEAGSGKIVLDLSRYQAEQLIWGLRRNLLAGGRVGDVHILDGHPSVPVSGASVSRYDVFLCHNSADKTEVKRIGLRLRNRGISPWLDEWELRPGIPWQRELETTIEDIPCAAVFVGTDGLGPWQSQEVETFLRQFVDRRCPVIPVLLRSCTQVPRLPTFLAGMTWVDFRKRKPNPYHQLEFGIKGVRPVG